MDYGAIISESIDYTREALFGRWVRWLIFIVCTLPFALFPFVFDMKKIIVGSTLHWELVAWDQVAAILIAGFLLSFIVSGYLVRIYRGIAPAPEFDNWGSMYLDGIKLTVLSILWFIPLMVVIAFQFALIFSAIAGGSNGPGLVFIGLLLLSLVVEFVLFVITFCYSILGYVRFARTGSIREGIRFSKITETIRSIGWGSYLVALIVMFVIGFIFVIISMIVSLVPYIGWVIQLVITPLYSIFIARYIARIYDHGEPQGAAPPG
jgi:hypothetical protein